MFKTRYLIDFFGIYIHLNSKVGQNSYFFEEEDGANSCAKCEKMSPPFKLRFCLLPYRMKSLYLELLISFFCSFQGWIIEPGNQWMHPSSICSVSWFNKSILFILFVPWFTRLKKLKERKEKLIHMYVPEYDSTPKLGGGESNPAP